MQGGKQKTEREKRRARAVRRRRRRWFSPLARGMLLVNLVGPAVLVAGLLFLEGYEDELIESDISVLKAQATLVAEALGETASAEQSGGGGYQLILDPELARRLINRFASPDGPRVRLFLPDQALLVDSRRVLGAGGLIQIENLAPPDPTGGFERRFNRVYDWIAPVWERFVRRRPVYRERPEQAASDYPEAMIALAGSTAGLARRLPDGRLILSAAAPTKRFKQVIGAVLLSHEGDRVAAAVRSVRYDILRLFGGAVLLSFAATLYLAGAISRPLRALAHAADRARGRTALDEVIPDLSRRRDEIGDLSTALRDMTESIQTRMVATERFAADVAHEIKNPLTSLKSAVETVARVNSEEQRDKLLAVIQNDVQRLDRLISDISDASRLDAELSREEVEPVDVVDILRTLVEIETASLGEGARAQLRLEAAAALGDGGFVQGVEVRLGQVFRNLIGNARSFSPPEGRIELRATRTDDRIIVSIEDEGPGIPPGKEDAIFERFYSERPSQEAFGGHSGLGLSISRQIVVAHGGSLVAENRLAPDGSIIGARFIVALPRFDHVS